MLVLIRGAGDLASGIATRLYRAGFRIVMTDIAQPTTVRRTVAFSDAVVNGTAEVEGITARRAASPEEALRIAENREIPILVDPEGSCRNSLKPDVTVDAILAKKNLGTRISDAPLVIGVGPGFTAGEDCHAVIETKRGHTLGRVIYRGSAIPNTAVPGVIGGYSTERILRAPADGVFKSTMKIRDLVKAGDVVGYVGDEPMKAQIDGVIRGLLQDGVPVTKGMKSGDVDPRGEVSYCDTVSDKALAIGGGVLEAILALGQNSR